MTTIGVDFKLKTLTIGQKQIKVQIWDTAGQERFRNITNSYYRGAHGVAIVFDVTNLESFTKVSGWMKQIATKASQNTLKVLIANKTDMVNLRVVSEEAGRKLSQEFGIYYFETSAKDDIGVNDAFDFLVNKIFSNVEVEPDFLNITQDCLLQKVNNEMIEKIETSSKTCNFCVI